MLLSSIVLYNSSVVLLTAKIKRATAFKVLKLELTIIYANHSFLENLQFGLN